LQFSAVKNYVKADHRKLMPPNRGFNSSVYSMNDWQNSQLFLKIWEYIRQNAEFLLGVSRRGGQTIGISIRQMKNPAANSWRTQKVLKSHCDRIVTAGVLEQIRVISHNGKIAVVTCGVLRTGPGLTIFKVWTTRKQQSPAGAPGRSFREPALR
jgi:hypothetical protein